MIRFGIIAALSCAFAAFELARAQPPEPNLFEVLQGKDTEQLVELLAHRNADIRLGAAEWLHGLAAQGGIDFRPCAKKSLPAVIKAMQKPEAEVQGHVIPFVGFLGPSAEPAVPTLIALLGDKNPEIRRASAFALKQLGLTAKQATPALIKSLNDDNEYVRLHSAAALVLLKAGGKRPLNMIVEALATEDSDYSDQVIRTLGDFGLQAVPSLVNSLKAKNPKTRKTAALALGACARTILSNKQAVPPEVVQSIIQTLQDPDISVVNAAIWGVSDFREAAKGALPETIKCLKHQDSSVRWYAAWHLKYFGPHAEIAIPNLTDTLKDNDEWVRRAAAETIEAIRDAKVKSKRIKDR